MWGLSSGRRDGKQREAHGFGRGLYCGGRSEICAGVRGDGGAGEEVPRVDSSDITVEIEGQTETAREFPVYKRR